MSKDLREGALSYHRLPKPGKLEIIATKPLDNQRDLALAYSPGVAAACEAIVENPAEADNLTARQNLVAVISNGTAVLGLGDIGPLASKPVMEGKAVLFKKFAGIDVFDIEVNEKRVSKLVDVICALEPTFGGINLEDIKAPECFEVEAQCRERMQIPVFHDDQHGTAIIVASAVLNAMELAGKKLDQVKLVTSGAGAAALACLNLLVSLGVKRENIWVTDIEGVVYKGRVELMDAYKAIYAQETSARKLAEIIEGADIFLGLSAAGVLKPELLRKMAGKPLIMALANPNPEIMPEVAYEARPDAMICTGRSDYPNQVNNVLCFPYMFRGALDCAATTINEAMKLAAVRAIAELAREAPSDVVARAYGGEARHFGAGSLIPSPFDPRLILRIAPAVAKAAMASGVARAPIGDFAAYQERLSRFVFRSGFIMKPIFQAAKENPRRVIYAEGEDERALRAAQTAMEENFAIPILVGRPAVIEARIKRFGLAIRPGTDFEIINPDDDPRYRDYVATYLEIAGRKGITPEAARTQLRTNSSIIAAVAVRRGDADAMICGLEGRYRSRLQIIRDVIGMEPGVTELAAMSLMITSKGAFFLADTHVNEDPTAEQLAEIGIRAAAEVRRFGIEPKIALISHSDFGSHDSESARKMRRAAELIAARAPQIEVDGEMQADSALSDKVRERVLPHSNLKGVANILLMPDLDAANIANELTKVIGDALPVGPILLGTAYPAHIATSTTTARGVVNLTAIAVVQAQSRQG
ncbi:MAG: NADP-dependent malic enzyme [Methylobacterium sp.]|nr:NADP-dependent malic enzyme [Methylobacterium sp.]MCA3599880.1 NADP-dependent malic enzyme [Methylobacterium sp.]MCA3609464.1 NADP-dependent malic enzyme [Methylobacterium sp.]MCA3618672.1 NADP-dependent malic enzyme [Methylobacterium sp.]MCA3620708.1 NADP-dependent malic enzyme [Methylobacterium sp.]